LVLRRGGWKIAVNYFHSPKNPEKVMLSQIRILRVIICAAFLTFLASLASAQSSSPLILALSKSEHTIALVDPTSLKVLIRLPSGPDPHEVIASGGGKFAYISNYGGLDSTLHTISVIDLVAHKALPPIDLGALRSAHGLAFAGGKLYFTAETNKAIGRYDPATRQVDWILGTGQDRTHMVFVSPSLDRIVTANVNSGTLSIIEQTQSDEGPPGKPRLTWKITNVPAGHGAEGFDVSPDGKEIWAANASDATVTIINVAEHKAIQTLPIPVKDANRLKFTPDGKRVLVSGLGAGASGDASLIVLEASTRSEVKRLSLGGGAAGILMTPDGSRAFVAVSTADKIAVVDLKTLEVTGQISVGKNPDGLAWAGK
jgi:YVTN family beta-propeller protein